MRVVLVVILIAAACGRRTPTAAPSNAPKPSPLDATVVGPDGPIAGARVRMLALPPAPCPCTESQLDPTLHYANEMPTCACPAALAQWRSRLAQCDAATGFVAEVISDPRGRIRLDPPGGITSLEAIGPAGVRWMPWPVTNAPIALALGGHIQPRIRITGAPRDVIRGAVLFEDGHCVPIDHIGDAWTPRVPLPRFDGAGGTLVIEAPGFATTLYSLFDQDVIDIALARATPISGTCAGTTVRLENPFQRIVAKVDSAQRFSIDGALAIDGTVRCWKDGTTLVDEWSYIPGEPLGPLDTYTSSGGFGSSCTDVMVVDAHNLPLADADVSATRTHSNFSWGSSGSTNARGIACLDDIDVGMTLEVTAPLGRCAGETAVKLTPGHLAQTPLTVRLRVQPLKGTTLRGRVIDAEGSPVDGASVTVESVTPTNPNDCVDSVGGAQSGLDGTFAIPSVPRGKVVVEAEHPWFVKRKLEFIHDGAAHDIVIPRGGRWTGRLLDPEGTPIRACSVSLRLADGRTIYSDCKAGAFDLKPIVAGEAHLRVRLGIHPLGTQRSFDEKVHLDATARHADIQFPRGEHISGRVVDKDGRGIPGAQLAAIPAGAMRPGCCLHEDEVQIVADTAGRFTFRHLKPGTWTINGIGRIHSQTTINVATGTTNATYVAAPK